MKFYEDLQKDLTLAWLEKNGYPHEIEHARAAFDGDVKAAQNLYLSLENKMRGTIAAVMWRAKVPVEAFRSYLSAAWEHDHQHVITAAETRRNLGHMFRYAAFQIPAEMPPMMTVWRGTSGITKSQAGKGYSWTTDQDTACWFAMRFAERKGAPLVLTSEIAKTDIALFTNERMESEIVLMRSPKTVVIDGDVSDWTMGQARFDEAKGRTT
jgi:hypothetical protein